jgi:hypothetical protein
MEYQLIQPPHLVNFRAMDGKQAREYFDWFIAQVPIRVAELKKYVQSTPEYKIWETDFTPESLDLLGKWLCEHIETKQRSSEGIKNIYANSPEWFRNIQIPDYDLSLITVSLSFDVGVYLSQVITNNVQGLRWEIVAKPKKDVNYHQPVLTNGEHLVLNPVGIVLTYAYGIAQGTKGPNRLRELYEIWSKTLAGKRWFE